MSFAETKQTKNKTSDPRLSIFLCNFSAVNNTLLKRWGNSWVILQEGWGKQLSPAAYIWTFVCKYNTRHLRGCFRGGCFIIPWFNFLQLLSFLISHIFFGLMQIKHWQEQNEKFRCILTTRAPASAFINGDTVKVSPLY